MYIYIKDVMLNVGLECVNSVLSSVPRAAPARRFLSFLRHPKSLVSSKLRPTVGRSDSVNFVHEPTPRAKFRANPSAVGFLANSSFRDTDVRRSIK